MNRAEAEEVEAPDIAAALSPDLCEECGEFCERETMTAEGECSRDLWEE